MSSREWYLKTIADSLAGFGREISVENGASFLDGNQMGEDLSREILNALFDWHLVNANVFHLNNPGFDLIDESQQILVQVSSNIDRQKIKYTLLHLDGHAGYHLYFVSLTDKHIPCFRDGICLPNGIIFNPSVDIFDCPTIVRRCRDADNVRLKRVYEVCRSYFPQANSVVCNSCASPCLTKTQLDRIVFCVAQIHATEELLIDYCDEYLASPESEGGKARRVSVNGMMSAQLHQFYLRSANVVDELLVELIDHFELWGKLKEIRDLREEIDLLPQSNDRNLDVARARILMAKEREAIEGVLRLASYAWPHPEQVYFMYRLATQ